mmetsp:Transcript_13007/g.9410  ORF Transcript_13007/g.9410 Transcript_13007/m.9410 type:complete len:103 (+) Transcript_13007:642-950(+)
MIVLNGIFLELATVKLNLGDGDANIPVLIVLLIVEIIVGAIVGLALGFAGRIFNRFDGYKYCMHAKLVYCIVVFIGYPVVSEILGFKEAKYIGSMMFGYMCY